MALIRRSRKKPDPALEAEGIRDVVRKTDANPQLVATARFLRRLIPGGEPETSEMPEPMRRLVEEVQPQGPSTLREIGKGALQAWQALSEAQRRRQGTADVAIVFTDLVGFSDWALAAGDEAALEVLQAGRRRRAEGDLLQQGRRGQATRRRGDGRLRRRRAGGLRGARGPGRDLRNRGGGVPPKQRAGVHRGTPRKVKGDFLGVDVNIAARVGDARKGGEVLVSGAVREELDGRRFKFGSPRELVAPGAPSDLTVCSVKRRRKR